MLYSWPSLLIDQQVAFLQGVVGSLVTRMEKAIFQAGFEGVTGSSDSPGFLRALNSRDRTVPTGIPRA